MMDLDSVLNGSKDEATTAEPAHEQAPEQQQPAEETKPEGDTPAVETPAAGEGEPPAPEQGKNVPLSALEAERKQRQDWKEKAIRAEEQLKALQAQPQAAQQVPGNPDFANVPPEVRQQLEAFNQRAEVSEMITRNKHGDEAVDKAHAAFAEAAQKNPALQAAMLQQQNPWDFVFREGSKLMAMSEIGEDPTAYRARVREELRQELLAEQGQIQPAQAAASPAVAIPNSLANARSSAPRLAPAHTGPTPLNDILKRG